MVLLLQQHQHSLKFFSFCNFSPQAAPLNPLCEKKKPPLLGQPIYKITTSSITCENVLKVKINRSGTVGTNAYSPRIDLDLQVDAVPQNLQKGPKFANKVPKHIMVCNTEAIKPGISLHPLPPTPGCVPLLHLVSN